MRALGRRGSILCAGELRSSVVTNGKTRRARLAWVLLPLVSLSAVAAGLWIVRSAPQGLAGWTLGAVLGAACLWILGSVLWPARAERTCPRCGAAALVRLDPRATHGLGCQRCGFQDESASAWLLAEEEGPLEELVLDARARRSRPPPPGRARTRVDSLGPPD